MTYIQLVSIRKRIARCLALLAISGVMLVMPGRLNGQPLQVVNVAIPAKSFQMVIYPVAHQKGYMKEEGLDERVIFVAPTTSIQAMLGGDVHFTGAGSSALVSISTKASAAANPGARQIQARRGNRPRCSAVISRTKIAPMLNVTTT